MLSLLIGHMKIMVLKLYIIILFLHANTLFNKVGTSYINALFLLLLIRWGASQILPLFFPPSFNEPFSLAHHQKKKKKSQNFEAHRNFYVKLKHLSIGATT
jgi:hypothetical protein